MTSLVVFVQTYTARLGREERGAGLVEYSLLLAFIVIVAILAVTAVGQETKSNFEEVPIPFNS